MPDEEGRPAHPYDEVKITFGQRLADLVATWVGSWPFIIIQSCLLAAWIIANVVLVWRAADPNKSTAWDPYPFILLNLVLSFQAAYTGPVVMMSQNRQAEKDRMTFEHDYEIDRQAEGEIRVMMEHLLKQDTLILKAIDHLEMLRTQSNAAAIKRMEDLLHRMDQADRRIVALLENMERLHPGGVVINHDDFPEHQHPLREDF